MVAHPWFAAEFSVPATDQKLIKVVMCRTFSLISANGYFYRYCSQSTGSRGAHGPSPVFRVLRGGEGNHPGAVKPLKSPCVQFRGSDKFGMNNKIKNIWKNIQKILNFFVIDIDKSFQYLQNFSMKWHSLKWWQKKKNHSKMLLEITFLEYRFCLFCHGF